MSEIKPNSILLETETGQLSVAPGEALEIPLILKNQSASPVQVRITVEGIPLSWVSKDCRPIGLASILPPGYWKEARWLTACW